MSNVYDPKTSTWKHVKDLGWLLRHWKDVAFIECQAIPAPSTNELIMQAHLKDGRIYQTTWASAQICRQWLRRPVFAGCKLWWINHWTTCGTTDGLARR